MRKTQRLDHAVIDQDDDIHEGANAALENGNFEWRGVGEKQRQG